MIPRFQEKFPRLSQLAGQVFSQENMLALAIALALIAIYIATAADAPLWLYQGF